MRLESPKSKVYLVHSFDMKSDTWNAFTPRCKGPEPGQFYCHQDYLTLKHAKPDDISLAVMIEVGRLKAYDHQSAE